MQYQILPVTPFAQNCTLLWCPHSRQAVVIDPGGECERIEETIRARNLVPLHVLLTHGHLDHAGAAGELARRLDVDILGPHPEDAFLLQALPEQAEMFGFPPAQPLEPDRWLQEGDTLDVGRFRLQVLHCPGHTPGHVVFHAPESALMQVGDVLFQGSIGRTDFPRGNHAQLLASIREKLLPLGDETAFIPGHGPMSTLGHEARHNPFLQ